jgi:metallo-beta-lactamase class B
MGWQATRLPAVQPDLNKKLETMQSPKSFVPARLAGVLAAALVCSAAQAAGPSAEALAKFNAPAEPFRIYGNTWYVGTQGLSSVLITSDYGHVLIDGGLPESAPLIAANVAKLGFKVADIKAILQSHAHPDHIGGIAALARESGAAVYARRPADEVLRTGKLPPEDPQFGAKVKIPTVPSVWVVHGDQLLGVGSNRLRAIATPGHTPGGTSWAWDACEGSVCLTMVYADSLAPVSGDKYRFSDHPEVLAQFDTSFQALEAQKCDVVISPHPEVSQIIERAQKAGGKADALKDPEGCKRYVAGFRQKLADRLAQEKAAPARK